MKTTKIRLLLVDDHACLLDALKALLQRLPDFEVVAAVQNGVSAVSSAHQLNPDIVILDVRLPGLSGIETAKLLNARCPKARVIGFSGYDDSDTVLQLMRAGAKGFVSKSADSSELVRAITLVFAGGIFLSPRISDQVKATSNDPSPALLSQQEQKVLLLIAEGLQSKEIASRLSTGTRTIEKHRQTIGKKLGISSIAGLVKFAIRNGIATLD